MSLSDDIHGIRDLALYELDSAHDYFTHTKYAWEVLRLNLKDADDKYLINNRATGNVITEQVLVDRSQRYLANQLIESTFQQFLSIFDAFFFDFLHLWLEEYPGSLSSKILEYRIVLDSPDKAGITRSVINKHLNEVLHLRPAEWFKYLNDLVKLGCPAEKEIERLAEAKASRDLLVHNRGVVNVQYLHKAGELARAESGQRIKIAPDYHQSTWELIRKIVDDITNTAINKLTKH